MIKSFFLYITVIPFFFISFNKKNVKRIKTNCGFEFSIPSELVKSKSYNYFSKSYCYDTVLTNNRDLLISVIAIDHSNEVFIDTIEYTKQSIELFKNKILSSKENFLDSSKSYLINNTNFGVIYYHNENKKPDLRASKYVYHKYIIFYINSSTEINISIEMKNKSYNDIDKLLMYSFKSTKQHSSHHTPNTSF